MSLIGDINTDQEAHQLSMLVNPPTDPYYVPAESLSLQDQNVHDMYQQLRDIIDNPSKYTEYEISEWLAEIEDNYPDRHGRYDGNYKAHLAEKNTLVHDFYLDYNRKYKSALNSKKSGVTSVLIRKPRDLGKEMYYLIDKVNQILNQSSDDDEEDEDDD